MTQASALSRLEKLAEEYWIRCPLPAKGSENYANEIRSAFIAGGKAMLSLLSEPGEACGPRLKAWKIKDTDGAWAAAEERFDTNDINFTMFVPLAELLQAQAGCNKIATVLQAEIQELKAALASSEARVRILSDALEKIREALVLPDAISGLCADQIAHKALLEVQR